MTAFVTEHITPFITAGHSVKVERKRRGGEIKRRVEREGGRGERDRGG